MGHPRRLLHLLWLVSFVTIYPKNNDAVEHNHVQNLTDNSLKTIPPSISNSSVTSLVIERNQITLTSQDRQSLASYPQLVDLRLDGNQVTQIPARYLSVVPHLSVLSLSRNQISSLQPDSFYGLNDLKVLNLSQNLLTSLPAKLFSELNNLQKVDLEDNPWNCSCQLLSVIREIKAAGVTNVGSNTKCASPEQQAGMHLFEALAKCDPISPPSSKVYPQNPPSGTTGYSQQPHVPKMMLTTSPDNRDQKPASGNTWRFAAYVAALALTTSVVIVCAIKGPSLYRLFHNYRHRRLRQDENQEAPAASSIYSETGRYMNHQTFTFEHHAADGEEDVQYFEDPYIKTEE
ncbi:leucine-rich repeat-containing protein 19-like [Syngnathoides biaculeatus]|uniref:leucine-rich repeat-containing protein 19-like n=1 Tax=Syngnathoides biaculeatus TaxID=300417 RepID=UPI002ADD32AC|nr:leucine-rich repeat-containing protein 19-like [Syngnathoides biaculeatus]XP_061661509.1 leucine-rich repeat-containing protein 19-like [Syngnathoides biaculeatus]XP_061661510.1 leucine-rich repeat-containing protein 19-like [Syngnathoides biaculeatus]